MTILFVLLTFLVVISVRYFIEPQSQPALETEVVVKPQRPRVKREYGFEIPQDYCFHPGHTWATKESATNARVGVDKFVAHLMGRSTISKFGNRSLGSSGSEAHHPDRERRQRGSALPRGGRSDGRQRRCVARSEPDHQ